MNSKCTRCECVHMYTVHTRIQGANRYMHSGAHVQRRLRDIKRVVGVHLSTTITLTSTSNQSQAQPVPCQLNRCNTFCLNIPRIHQIIYCYEIQDDQVIVQREL